MKQFCLKGHDTYIVGRYRTTCKTCHALAGKRWNLKHPQKRKRMALNSQWKGAGILNAGGSYFTQVDYDRQYQVQSGRCAGCKQHQSDLSGRLHADHDHSTGVFRRLLCGSCNRVIGIVHENPELLESLAQLLRG